MKKTIIGVVITIPLVIVTLIVGLLVYVSVSRNAIKDNYFNYIESLGYASEDTQIMEVEHSFLNKALGYNEWRISARFKELPDYTFWFSYWDSEIHFQGVTQEVHPDNGKILEYYERFEKGTLFDEQYS